MKHSAFLEKLCRQLLTHMFTKWENAFAIPGGRP